MTEKVEETCGVEEHHRMVGMEGREGRLEGEGDGGRKN